MTDASSPLLWEPPEGPKDRKDVWKGIIFEMIEDYPEADVIVTKENPGTLWAVLAIVSVPETRVLTELTHAIVAALRNAGLPAKPAL